MVSKPVQLNTVELNVKAEWQQSSFGCRVGAEAHRCPWGAVLGRYVCLLALKTTYHFHLHVFAPSKMGPTPISVNLLSLQSKPSTNQNIVSSSKILPYQHF